MVANSQTWLSDFHFLTFHPLWPRPQVNFDPSVPPTSYSICRESIGSGVIIYLESIGFSHHPSLNGSQPPPPLTLYTRSTQQLKGILCSMSDYDTQLLKPTPPAVATHYKALQWPPRPSVNCLSPVCLPLSHHSCPHPLHPGPSGVLVVSKTGQAHCCLRTFALAVLSGTHHLRQPRSLCLPSGRAVLQHHLFRVPPSLPPSLSNPLPSSSYPSPCGIHLSPPARLLVP